LRTRKLRKKRVELFQDSFCGFSPKMGVVSSERN